MTKYRWGTVFFVPTTWDGDVDTLDEHVIEEHPDQVSSFDKAAALWRIAGREDKAAAIERVLDRACGPENGQILRDADLAELDQAFAGLEAAIAQVHPDWRGDLPPERVEEYRAKYEALDLHDVQGQVILHSLLASVSEALDLDDLLRDARAKGVNVFLDFGR